MRSILCGLLISVFAMGALSAEEIPRGKETNLPIPRFVSLKAETGNARRGPSLSHRIDWIFQRRNLPLQVMDEYGHWRRIQDRDGQGGWMHYSLLSGSRHVIVERHLVPLRIAQDQDAEIRAYAEAGVVARLGACGLDWCQITQDGLRGWVEKRVLWGVLPEEIRN